MGVVAVGLGKRADAESGRTKTNLGNHGNRVEAPEVEKEVPLSRKSYTAVGLNPMSAKH